MQNKVEAVKKIKETISNAKAFYVAKYDGIDVENMTRLRRELRKNDSSMSVIKNKLFVKAIQEEKYFQNFEPVLKGANAFIFANDDASATSKVLFDFDIKGQKLEVKGCLFENEFFGPDRMSILKDLPSKTTLLSMLASVLNEPMSKLARTLDALKVTKEN